MLWCRGSNKPGGVATDRALINPNNKRKKALEIESIKQSVKENKKKTRMRTKNKKKCNVHSESSSEEDLELSNGSKDELQIFEDFQDSQEDLFFPEDNTGDIVINN